MTDSGLPTSGLKCKQPFWSVVGNHFVPTENCDNLFTNLINKELLRQKYVQELSPGEINPDKTKINKIVDTLILPVPPFDKSLESDVTCTGCTAGVNTYRSLIEDGFTRDRIFSLLFKVCADFKIMPPEICSGVLDSYGQVLVEVIDQAENKTAGEICTYLLNFDCRGEEVKWNVTFPATPKPPLKTPTPNPNPGKPLKVLQITDTHWDTQYAEGTWAECKEPLCCRKDNVTPNKNASLAGKYGGWKCDIPEITFDDMLTHVKKQHPDLDYILWTGDVPSHDIWSQDKNDTLEILQKTARKLLKAFPKTLIIPALGNHESVPPNMQVPRPNATTNPMDWLYDQLYKEWKIWLPANVQQTVRNGAFYTYLIKPNFRIVSMNMNFCYSMNWWLVIDSVDPLNHLQWLIDVLQEAEDKNEKVHIIGHIPPGNKDCLRMWQSNYYKIINRYESTVTAQFFGHTHSEKYELIYDEVKGQRAVAVSYVAPSVTTYTYLNPAYRIYYVEGQNPSNSSVSSRYVTDYETWYFDLEKANQEGKTEWKKLYSAKEDFNMTSLYPEDWRQFYEKMTKSDELLELYNK
ncbi:hypothetical protein RUM44_002597 [Polyplax serrata]|uniref:Sphingomyelin phosphodiesterase n=1 Tax=Polyplax serrata TaxID=468196 RepID=A0ABR1AF78_POLSC